MKENTSSGHEREQKRQHPNENRSQMDKEQLNRRDTDKEEGNMQHRVVGGAPEQRVKDTDQKHKEANRPSDIHK